MKKIIFTFFLFSLATFSNSNQDKYIIKDFNINKYLGTWFEIVRKENIFVTGETEGSLGSESAGGRDIFISKWTQ